MRRLSLRAASVSAPTWLRNRRAAPARCSDIFVNRVPGSWLGLLPCGQLAAAVLPVNLLLLGDNGLDGFDEAQIRLILVHVAVSARPAHVEALLALHPLRGGVIPGP